MILISACLVGLNCKYNGENNVCDKAVELVKNGLAIPVCPEQLGGLATPRTPAEIEGDKVIDKDGIDVTENFKLGANETLRLAQLVGAKRAILKQRSPSCGFGKIYDGTHTGTVTEGNGLTAKLLSENGIKILTEESI